MIIARVLRGRSLRFPARLRTSTSATRRTDEVRHPTEARATSTYASLRDVFFRIELPLPIVLPLLAHHGPDGWTISTEFADLFGRVPEPLRPYLVGFRHVLVDLARIDDEALSRHVRLRAFLKALKYIQRSDLAERIDTLLAEAVELESVDVVLLLTYIGKGRVSVSNEAIRAALHRWVPSREEETMAQEKTDTLVQWH